GAPYLVSSVALARQLESYVVAQRWMQLCIERQAITDAGARSSLVNHQLIRVTVEFFARTCPTVGCAMRTDRKISPGASLNPWCARRTLPGQLRRSSQTN
ncbi:hypothetical protein, partial [Pseudomonas sp. BN102]|uniref:hypothetical protein n=1 Tax=Pseudomonas sp. BN102 TaxID=2567886 RepID=UPI002456B930